MKPVITKAMQEQLLRQYEELLLANNSEAVVTPEQILTDEEVQSLFKITRRTLYRYRKQGKIHYFKLGNRSYYFRPILFLNMLKLYQDA